MTIVEFNENANLDNWYIVDDVVMGGRSDGNMYLNEEGIGVFTGDVSLENNGGFSSVRCWLEEVVVDSFTTLVARVKGDGKTYQMRIKTNADDPQSYVKSFDTSGEWQDVAIPLASMYPSFRGRVLDMPNFDAGRFEELAFLIANGRNESFRLEIKRITLR